MVEELTKKRDENPMLKPRIDKVTVNISVGKSGEPLEKATKILKQLTRQEPCKRNAKKTVRDFGIRKGEPIACMVTLRKEKAVEFLKRALQAVDNKISKNCFDKHGNFAFGIKEHIEIPGVKYVPELGIVGMDVAVSIVRPGYRVKARRRGKSVIGKKHLMTPEVAVPFVKETLGVEIV
ncbi:MAG: 50S ribosomal protein L5 [Candidatus Bathyarchaeia archaeon]|jgi:large subunit ribosomal protein L5|nr:50S ribosomal protein L5 [Candidatus Bathyarchaeota archaeon A05DMB-4]MDH7595617.1 50S ribosomal protein L5 [Candidatus Bathyarchaeota archaeon]